MEIRQFNIFDYFHIVHIVYRDGWHKGRWVEPRAQIPGESLWQMVADLNRAFTVVQETIEATEEIEETGN